MTTDEILKNIEEVQFTDIWSYENFSFLSDEDFKKLEKVDEETTNPRRDYVGTKYTFLNKEDNRYFQVEFYGNDNGSEIWSFGEVEKVTEMKEVVRFIKKK